ncbi:MAG: hypothetical protein H3C43_11070 [Leptonema sp. (in: Bacteria)]|nr:hypothetical protein [Leptonema sp. (in: bacteria)]
MVIRATKLVIGISLIWFLASCQSTQTQDGTDNGTATDRNVSIDGKGCVSGDCQNGTGTYIYDTKDKYTGAFKNGLRNGMGIMEYSNGDRFEGQYENDSRQGNGTYIFANKDVFVGQFVKGIREGAGSYTFSESGETFIGQLQNDGNQGEGSVNKEGDEFKCKLNGRKLQCESKPTVKPQ